MPRFLFAGLLSLATAGLLAAEPVRFNRDVRPIFSDTCFACHGPDKNQRQAGLRLDVRESATSKLESGLTAIVPGKPEESELVRRLTAEDEAERMPPHEFHKVLTPEQIALLTRWVAEGAEYEPHWAYVKPVRTEPPAVEGGVIRNPIDAFIQARLKAEGLAPSPEADKRTLIRRVTLDLHGFPPTPEEVEAFVADTSEDAYGRLVDRLLASPRFAERQTQHWLDAVRYADTVGFHGDQITTVWPYRDYILRAFHENKPFDEFTREQLAGDLLPNATRDQKVASAFNRLNRMTAEGGAQDKEYLAKYAADRVRTVSVTWLGSTLGCAECHDHKFDPFTTKDFYRLEAFFADIEEKGFYGGGGGGTGIWGSSLTLPAPEQEAELARIGEELSRLRAEAAAVTDDSLAAGRGEWERRTLELDTAGQLAWSTLEPTSLVTERGAELTHAGGGLIVAGGPNPDNETYVVAAKPGAGHWTSLRLRIEGSGDLSGNGISRGWVSFLLTEVEAELQDSSASSGAASQRLAFTEVVGGATGNAERYPSVAVIDGDPATGWGDAGGGPGRNLVLRFAEPLETTADSVLTIRLQHDSDLRRATIGRFRLNLSRVEGATAEDASAPDNLLAALRAAAESRTDEQTKLLAARYRTVAPELAEFRRRETEVARRRALLAGSFPAVLVTQARTEPRSIRVLPRGNWMDDSGEIVEPNVPEFLGLLNTEGRRADRLDLANWLASTDNPLTARVFVNRLWKQFFGTGLSKVLEDVGSQGEAPTHPELLDWLAVEFMQPTPLPEENRVEGTHAWDVKHVVKLIVTSHTYRQASDVEPSRADPDNRRLTRQAPIRVDAEAVRDIALAVSGLLKERFGGPSVAPVQPDGYYAALNFPRREYSASRGDDLYRRSVYSHWQRTFLHPSLLVFDASTREECQVARSNSNTPLQSLVLLNDPIFVEAARAFAQKATLEGGSTPADRLTWSFRRALARDPSKAEFEVLAGLHAAQLARFRADPAAAEALLSVGEAPRDAGLDPVELAALTTATRAILNLHETITRD